MGPMPTNELLCPRCGTSMPGPSRFCPACGQAMARLSPGQMLDGKYEGAWQVWKDDGSPNEELSGTYVQGKKQ